MSSAVAEANSHLSTQTARPKAGQGNQAPAGDGFSGLVDDNLAATSNGDASPAERQQKSARTEGEGAPAAAKPAEAPVPAQS